MVSTPTNLMGPADLASEAQVLAANKGGACDVTIGQDLLEKNFPAIHAVGRAAEQARAPRLIDFKWGTSGPKLTLVGKGVCFDTGGLDLKSAGNMRLMKKDMGGAAHVLAVASMVMDLGLPVQLRVLIPAVENSVAGNAFRPGDVIDTRKGISVEVGNTDAEGRLVLADALALACEDTPDLLIDFATLTGAARVALGPDLPAVFTNDDGFAAHIQHASNERLDPTWRLPLHPAYRSAMASNFADTNNISESMPMGGAITAALFLEKFVAEGTTWAHLDVMAYNTRSKPGRPAGGEAMGVLAIYDALKAQLRL
ncbi:MAG: leucyl aminopeptidase family protein [Alphaproteobacteria bacterium]